jgi:RND family efflux transporter MFP subunit
LKLRKYAWSLLPILAVTSLAAAGCNRDGAAAAGPRDGKPPAPVQMATIEEGSFDVAARFVGRLRAQSAAEIYARTEGPVTAVHVGSGDRVRQGQLLALIDAADAQQRVEQARAALRMAEATWGQRQSSLELARSQAARITQLFGQKLVSQSDYDIAQGELANATAQLELARAQIEQARANLNAAQLDLAKTRIVAPFDGYIGTRHLDLGAQASTNRPIFSIVDLSVIRTTIAVPAQDAVHVRQGQRATVTADVLPGQSFAGTVARISSVYDPQTNTVEAEVEVPNPDGVLRPGMYGSVAIAYRNDPKALLVPLEAVRTNEMEQWIFVAEREGDTGLLARRVGVRSLQSASREQSRVAIEPLDGELTPGMNVIVLGHELLSDGAKIAAVKPDGAGGRKEGSGSGKKSSGGRKEGAAR